MATKEQPKKRPASPDRATPPQTSDTPSSLATALGEAAKSGITSALLEKRPYLKYAFANPYNLSMLGGALAAAAMTLNPVLAVAAIGIEFLWLLYAPDSKRLQHLFWDPRFEQFRESLLAEQRAGRLQLLSEDDRARVQALIARQRQIRRLASAN